MTEAWAFVEFWLRNSVHADEQMTSRRRREAVQALTDQLICAAEDQGADRAEIEAEIGNIYDYIRASIDSQNISETARLKLDGH
jgi:hypothetical protein